MKKSQNYLAYFWCFIVFAAKMVCSRRDLPRIVLGGDTQIIKPHYFNQINISRPSPAHNLDEISFFDPEFDPFDSKKEPGYCKNCVCGVGRSTRIVNGDLTSTDEFPWAAAIHKNGEHHCGASLITRKHLLTAGHCFDGYSKKHMVAHLADKNRYFIKSIRVHENYERNTYNNDIAIIELDRPVIANKKVRTVCLPNAEPVDNSGEVGIAIGWGRLGQGGELSKTLRKVNLPIMSDEQCKSSNYPSNRLTKNMFCAGYLLGGKDSCQGDSGGALHVRKPMGNMEVIGIVSFGRGCARPFFPGVYTKVSNYVNWIVKTVQDECICAPPPFEAK